MLTNATATTANGTQTEHRRDSPPPLLRIWFNQSTQDKHPKTRPESLKKYNKVVRLSFKEI